MEKHAFKCDGCVEVFDTKTKVLEHKKAMHGFKCGKCDESFEEYPLLGDHLRNYHSFRCKICSSFFDSAKTFGNHVKEEHFFKCDACEESFELSENLTSHQDETHRSCETCEDEFVWAETGHSCSYTDCKPLVEPIYSTRPAEGKTIGNVVQSMKDCLSKVEVQEYRWIDTKQMLAEKGRRKKRTQWGKIVNPSFHWFPLFPRDLTQST